MVSVLFESSSFKIVVENNNSESWYLRAYYKKSFVGMLNMHYEENPYGYKGLDSAIENKYKCVHAAVNAKASKSFAEVLRIDNVWILGNFRNSALGRRLLKEAQSIASAEGVPLVSTVFPQKLEPYMERNERGLFCFNKKTKHDAYIHDATKKDVFKTFDFFIKNGFSNPKLDYCKENSIAVDEGFYSRPQEFYFVNVFSL